ncbi:hypothetical protein HJC23_008799 [Cyclotella cryptica]|uniref:Uncharacterized protein n=1 Tax=Cyclotella cryptica TaxID=29204 RepID=A0ABD3PS01_9STRA|eukprot:CCRYP_012208-RA/>CCRYP_012208-RA protein AED:0.20 eAED:0.20 QI:0/-1/0/1/-1/1/1/0/399
MRTKLPLPLLLCLLLAIIPKHVLGFSPPSRLSSSTTTATTTAASKRANSANGTLLHVATMDGAMFVDDGRGPPSPTTKSLQQQQRQQRSLKYLTVAIGGYLALLLQKLTWEGLLSYPADCTADVLEASCRRNLPGSMALGTAFVSLFAACRMIVGSSLRLSFSSLTGWYLRRLEAAPLITKCVTGALIAFSGDYGAQWFEYKSANGPLSNKRSDAEGLSDSSPSELVTSSPRAGSQRRKTSALSIHGTYNIRRGIARFLECLLISSPLMHYGYDLFERIVPTTSSAASGLSASLAAISHVVADSVFLDGIFVMTGIIATGLLEGHPLRKVLPNLRNVYVPTLKASVVTSSALMPLQFLSFRFLPVQLRVLSVNAVDLIWTGVVSFVSHSDSHHHVDEGA